MKLSKLNISRHLRARWPVGLVVAGLSLATLALGADAVKLVPFQARGIGQITNVTEIPPSAEYPFGASALEAVDHGVATHTGEFTGAYQAIAGVKFVLVDGVPTPMFFIEGTVDLTADDGDHMYWDFISVSPAPPPPVLDTITELHLLGGTGRFAGATGAICAVGPLDLGTGAFHYVSSGQISSVGSNKKNP